MTAIDPDDSPEVAPPDDMSALFKFLNDKLNTEDLATAEQLVENLIDSFGTNAAADRRTSGVIPSGVSFDTSARALHRLPTAACAGHDGWDRRCRRVRNSGAWYYCRR